jgi:predicted nuclease of predicted toxin-antitoxin system
MILFQFDEHVPPAIARALRQRGISVLTPGEAGLLGLPDAEILERARSAGRVVVTHDIDFLRLHFEQVPHTGIAYCAQRTRTVGQLVAILALIHEVLEPSDMIGRLEYL